MCELFPGLLLPVPTSRPDSARRAQGSLIFWRASLASLRLPVADAALSARRHKQLGCEELHAQVSRRDGNVLGLTRRLRP